MVGTSESRLIMEPKVLKLSPRRIVLLSGLAGFIVLGALAIYASPMSARTLENKLQEAAVEALYQIRADEWAEVYMNGQVATLEGLAPSVEARNEAVEAVSHAAWAGGVVAGGITKVIDNTRVDSRQATFRVRADLNSGRIALRGVVPDAAGRDRLEALAERFFPSRVTLNVRIAPGSAPAGWDMASRIMIGELSRLEAGAAVIENNRFAVTGLAPNEQTARSVQDTLQTPPPGYASVGLVRVPGEDFTGEILDPALCETAIAASLSARALAFNPGTATLDEASRASLRRAGSAYDRCEAGHLFIGVKPDPRDGGVALAAERADALKAAMSTGSERPDRIRTRVLDGEALDRITFTVTSIGETNPDLASAILENNGD